MCYRFTLLIDTTARVVFLFHSDSARLWTVLTAAVVGADAVAAIPSTVPDHAYFPLYGPDFQMATREKTLPDKNDQVFLDRCGTVSEGSPKPVVEMCGPICLVRLRTRVAICAGMILPVCGELATASMVILQICEQELTQEEQQEAATSKAMLGENGGNFLCEAFRVVSFIEILVFCRVQLKVKSYRWNLPPVPLEILE